MVKKSFTIIGLIIYFSIILTTYSPYQNYNLFQGSSSFSDNNEYNQLFYSEDEDYCED